MNLYAAATFFDFFETTKLWPPPAGPGLPAHGKRRHTEIRLVRERLAGEDVGRGPRTVLDHGDVAVLERSLGVVVVVGEVSFLNAQLEDRTTACRRSSR